MTVLMLDLSFNASELRLGVPGVCDSARGGIARRWLRVRLIFPTVDRARQFQSNFGPVQGRDKWRASS
jgi:hypothetical protein